MRRNDTETASTPSMAKSKLRNLLDDATFAQANKIQVVEVIMEVLDAPLARAIADCSGNK